MLVDPITSLLLAVVWNDVIVSCLSGGFIHSSKETYNMTQRNSDRLEGDTDSSESVGACHDFKALYVCSWCGPLSEKVYQINTGPNAMNGTI